jgi:Flp pilus assembly pilin Flp
MELRKKILAFLRDEDGISGIEYAVLGVIIVLAIVVVLSTFIKKGK